MWSKIRTQWFMECIRPFTEHIMSWCGLPCSHNCQLWLDNNFHDLLVTHHIIPANICGYVSLVVTLYGVFNKCSSAKGPSYCLLLELLDVSVSELLVHSSQHGCSMWITQHCARDILEALAFLHHKGYVHADLKPHNILWSAEEECFKLIDFGLSFKEGNQVGWATIKPFWQYLLNSWQ